MKLKTVVVEAVIFPILTSYTALNILTQFSNFTIENIFGRFIYMISSLLFYLTVLFVYIYFLDTVYPWLKRKNQLIETKG